MSPFTDDDDVIQMRGTNNQRAYAGLMPEHHIDPEQYDAKYVVVFTTLAHSLNPEAGPIFYGDEVKWRWMA